MKASLLPALPLLLLALNLFPSARAEQQDRDDLISITVDQVMLADVVRIFARFSDAEFHYDPEDRVLQRSVTFSVNDKPWQPVLRGVLGQHGFMLLENEPSPGAYTVTRARNEAVSARVRSAQEANTVVGAALEALEAGHTEKAVALLTEFKKNNLALIKSATQE